MFHRVAETKRLIFKLLLWPFWWSVRKPILFNTYMTDYTSIPHQTTKQMSPPRMPSGCWITFLLQWHGLHQDERGFSQGGNYFLLIWNLNVENSKTPEQFLRWNKLKNNRGIQSYPQIVNRSLVTNIFARTRLNSIWTNIFSECQGWQILYSWLH